MALPTSSTAFHLRSAGRSALNYLNDHLRKKKAVVVATQVDVLAAIANFNGCHEAKVIALLMNLAECTVRKSLARLEHKGLVTSARSARDRRRNVYRLTDAGCAALAAATLLIEDALQPVIRHRLQPLSATLHDQLRSIVVRLQLQRYVEGYVQHSPFAYAEWAGSPGDEALRIQREIFRHWAAERARERARKAAAGEPGPSPPESK